MRFRATPSKVSGRIAASPSKSYTHRAILLAALSGGPSRIGRPLLADDTEATVDGVRAFGAEVARRDGDLVVASKGLRPPSGTVDARNSGTTLRLLAGVAATLDGSTTLTGDASLRKRPMGPLLDALEALGARARSLGGRGLPPVEIAGPLVGGSASIPGSVSSQFISSLLVASPLARGSTRLRVLPPLRSEPYVEVTRDLMAQFGAEVTRTEEGYETAGGQGYRATDVEVPGDYSSAAFPLVAAALTDGDVTVDGLHPESPQGDRGLLDVLRSFGASVEVAHDAVRVRGGPLRGQRVDVGNTPDLFPVLAVLATQSEGPSRFVNGEHLRLKESDRIETTVALLKAMGADVEPTRDGCVVRGSTRLREAFVESHGDHRILMAAAVAGLVADGPVDISEPSCYRISYPSFLEDLRSLGAAFEVVP